MPRLPLSFAFWLHRYSLYTLANYLDSDEMQLQGVTYVESMEDFSIVNAIMLSQQMNKKDNKELISLATDCFPIRTHGVYVMYQRA